MVGDGVKVLFENRNDTFSFNLVNLDALVKKDDGKNGMRNFGQPGQMLPRPIWYRVVIALLYSLSLFAWLFIKPAPHDVVVSVDSLAQAGSFLVAILLCFNDFFSPKRWRRGRSVQAATPTERTLAQRWIPRLFGCTIVSVLLGQIISLYYTQLLQVAVPSPSLADVCNLSAYLSLILCLLFLPGGTFVKTTRWRILVDSLMMIMTVITYSWYFLLGPTLLQANETMLARIVQVSYPFADLMLIFCVLFLLSHSIRPALRPTVLLFSIALVLLAITDSVTNYQTLHGTYVVGELIDVGWPLSYILIGVAVKSLRLSQQWDMREAESVAEKAPASFTSIIGVPSSLWRSSLPYLLIPITLLLIIYAWQTSNKGTLALGVYLGGMGLIGMVLVRQAVAIKETIDIAQRTRRLNNDLRITQEELQEKNRALSEANVRLASLATTDPLTGLPNHRSLFQQLEKELDRAYRHGRPFSLLFFDGDRFKRVNDTHGHAVGDVVLQELAERVNSVLRGGDTPGRYGGEEFLIILPETGIEEACDVAERVRGAIAMQPLALSHVAGGIAMTISIGVASYPLDGKSAGELVQKADQAMYWAKRLGRNQIRTCADALRASRDEAFSATIHLLERRDSPLLEGVGGDQERRTAQLKAVQSLMWLIELRDHDMSRHSYHVSDMATAIAIEMGLDAQRIFDVSTAALLHDIGKIAIPDALLQKTAPLSENEWVLMKQHAELGAQILEVNPALHHLMPAIRHHHERWDGSGYPDGLAGDAVPLEARIIGIAEAYDNMITHSTYAPARSVSSALAELHHCAGGQFDPAVVKAICAVCQYHEPGESEQREIAESVA